MGVIFHEDWNHFSPLLYSHNGAELRIIQLQEYLRDYKSKYTTSNNDGHKYNADHMMVGYIQSIEPDIHVRVQNLSGEEIVVVKETHEYRNCFDGGCWIVNVSEYNFGDTIEGSCLTCGGNIVKNDLQNRYLEKS